MQNKIPRRIIALEVEKMAHVFLAAGILAEIIASGLLKKTDGFHKILPTIFCLIGYIGAYYLVSLSLNIAYATWCGVGTVATALIGVLYYKEKMSLTNIAGLLIMTIGIVMLNYC